MDYLPPEIIFDLDTVIEAMQPEDIRILREYCMIHFPTWLWRIIKREAEVGDMTPEDFVRTSCMNEIMNRINERHKNEKSKL